MTKTITFAACHFTVAFSVAYLLTGDIGVSSIPRLVRAGLQHRCLLFPRTRLASLRPP